jgi:hypothetical protein
LADGLSDDGEKEHVAAAGRPLHASETAPVNPFVDTTLVVTVVELPAETVADPAEVLNPKVGVLPVVGPFVMPASRPCTSPVSPAVKYTVLVSPPLTAAVPVTAVPPGKSSHRLG